MSHAEALTKLIRDIPDYPKPGILFKDITPLLASPTGFALALEEMCAPLKSLNIDVVVGTEARGFLFGPSIAQTLGAGFVPVRKPGKLPWKTYQQEYQLEYGTDKLEIHQDALKPGQRVALVDDLLATGGTIAAAKKLVELTGAQTVACSFLIELGFLNGRQALNGLEVFSVIQYGSEE